jgi:predicted metal-binding membrane protein
MNLYWIVGLAVFVFFEKSVPVGHWLGYATGAVLSVGGVAMLTLAF